MARLSQLVEAAENASPDQVEEALRVLEGRRPNREITTAEACEMFKVSKRTVIRHCKPIRRIGGINRYLLSEVEAALVTDFRSERA